MFSTLLMLGLCFGSISNSEYSQKKIEKISYQQYSVKAYLVYQGSFVEGTINVQSTQRGLIPTVYNFSGIANRQTYGSFYPNTSFTPLNPNNQYAIKYNFTHTISIPNLGTAYVTF